ncbi:unnamed protein product [Prorocentrum cordatum]|uniref:Uncharacterized protein n=1 Tax=Prorocentrum cordatum TaxID=2364126 RepID=A0ABN9YAI0_9DINO|nr:unnamed protein product [Polarella glacialis]
MLARGGWWSVASTRPYVSGDKVESLRRAASTAAAPPQGAAEVPRRPSADSSTRRLHESQLALMTTIDELRADLQQAQRRAAEAERGREELSAELGRLRLEPESASASSTGSPASARLRGELQEARRGLEQKRKEVLRLEDDSLKLREELNTEKQKVLELKKDGHRRKTLVQEELGKLTDELGAKEMLEEEVRRLRTESARYRRGLEQASSQAERLQRELDEARAAKTGATRLVSESHHQMDMLSSSLSGQLMAVESELREQTQKTSQLLELFLQHSQTPMQRMRRSCRRIAMSGEAGDPEADPWLKQVPPIFETDVHHLQDNLVLMVNLIRYLADVHEARDNLLSPGSQSHAGATYSERAGARPSQREHSIVSQLEDTVTGFATKWLQSGM